MDLNILTELIENHNKFVTNGEEQLEKSVNGLSHLFDNRKLIELSLAGINTILKCGNDDIKLGVIVQLIVMSAYKLGKSENFLDPKNKVISN